MLDWKDMLDCDALYDPECSRCNGDGWIHGAPADLRDMEDCPDCHGSGWGPIPYCEVDDNEEY